MYDEELKEKFLSLNNNSIARRNFEGMFRRTERYENEIAKELALFSKEETVSMLSSMSYKQYYSIDDEIRRIKRYKKWYSKETGHDFFMSEMDFSIEDIDLSQYFRRSMAESLDKLLLDCHEDDPANGSLMQPLIVLLYYGMSLSEILDLRNDDVKIYGKFAMIECKKRKFGIENTNAVNSLDKYKNCRGGRNAKGIELKVTRNGDKFLYKMSGPGSSLPWRDTSLRAYVNNRRQRLSPSQYSDEYLSIRAVKAMGEYHRAMELLDDGYTIEKVAAKIFEGQNYRKTDIVILERSVKAYRKAFDF